MPTPSFIIIGARKAGTNSAFLALDKHPQVTMRGSADDKWEVRYFTQFRQRGDEWYKSLWTGVGVEGEKSPDYLGEIWCHKHLAQVCPDAKLIALLRNPIDRAYSEWQDGKNHNWMHGMYNKPFEGVMVDSGPDAQCFRHGYYSRHLTSLFAHFPKTQVHVAIAERLWNDPIVEFERIEQFLGISVRGCQAHRYPRIRPTQYEAPMRPETRKLLRDHYSFEVEGLRALLKDPIPEWDFS